MKTGDGGWGTGDGQRCYAGGMRRRVLQALVLLVFVVLGPGCKLFKKSTAAVTITTERIAYAPGETIVVSFSRALTPASGQKHWITIVPSGARESEYGKFHYVSSGLMGDTVEAPSTPGMYEVRLHDEYPRFMYKVLARAYVNVSGTSAMPTAPTTPTTIPTTKPTTAVAIGSVPMSTSKTTYAVGDVIGVSFGRPLVTPSGQQYWLTLCPSGARDSEWGTWHYVKPGATSDSLSAAKPGVYEVRLHDLYPSHSYGVIARQTVIVR